MECILFCLYEYRYACISNDEDDANGQNQMVGNSEPEMVFIFYQDEYMLTIWAYHTYDDPLEFCQFSGNSDVFVPDLDDDPINSMLQDLYLAY